MIEAEKAREFASLKWLEAGNRIDRLANNFVWSLSGHRFDLNAAFCAGDNQRCGSCAIQQNCKIKFARDVRRLGDEDLVHDAAGWTGLMGHQSLSEHFAGNVAGLSCRFNDVDAASESVRECSLPPTAGVDLRLYDDFAVSKIARDRFRFISSRRDPPASGSDTEFFEKFLRLIFVDVHSPKTGRSCNYRADRSSATVFLWP